jgi:hypothetical protein
MSILRVEEAINYALNAYAALTTYTSTRIYPDMLPQDCILPAVVYTRQTTENMSAMGGDTGVVRSEFQVIIHAETKLMTIKVAAEVRNALTRWRGSYDYVIIQGSFLQNENDEYESDLDHYAIVQTYTIWYSLAPGAGIVATYGSGLALIDADMVDGYHASDLIGKGYLWIPAGSITPDTCSDLITVDSDPNLLDALAFDGAVDEYATFTFHIENWDLGTIKAKFVWAASAAMTNNQTVIWGLNAYAVSDGDTVDVAFNAGEQTVSDTYATGDETGPIQKISSPTGAITVQGSPAVGDVIHCRVHRDADTDTITIDAWLLGVMIEYGKTVTTAW